MGALLFFSDRTDLLGATSPWFVTGVAGFFAFSFDRRAGNPAGLGSKRGIGGIALAVLILSLGLIWLPNQNQIRNQYFFPQQYALNLIRPLGPRSLLVSGDPFEYYGALEAQWMEPSSRAGLVLDERELNKRWYLSEWISRQPELLFSLADPLVSFGIA
jgi:hypothetical protein